ncbi:hypothetical protein RN001_001940 [Aquatica leii]|uniref:Chemosensory protein n=1 Tax=Aquatica leii TaxID=1421715 RepID=A0AAN7PGH0_9COLE|nr:hypothetical protein RN001_001940 [Aquatica leii]
MESFYRILILALAFQVSIVNCQLGLTGSNYIEQQLLCALDRGPCDVFGQQIKQALPGIIGNNCVACDQRRLANVERVARFVQKRYPNAWEAIVVKYS